MVDEAGHRDSETHAVTSILLGSLVYRLTDPAGSMGGVTKT